MSMQKFRHCKQMALIRDICECHIEGSQLTFLIYSNSEITLLRVNQRHDYIRRSAILYRSYISGALSFPFFIRIK